MTQGLASGWERVVVPPAAQHEGRPVRAWTPVYDHEGCLVTLEQGTEPGTPAITWHKAARAAWTWLLGLWPEGTKPCVVKPVLIWGPCYLK